MTEAMEVDQAVPPTTTANDNQNGDDNGAIAAPITEEGHEKKAETNGSGEKVVEIIMGEPEISAEAGESSSKPTVEEPNILKTSAPMDEKDYSKNVKYDPSVLPESDDAYEIRKQVSPDNNLLALALTFISRLISTLVIATFRATSTCSKRQGVRPIILSASNPLQLSDV